MDVTVVQTRDHCATTSVDDLRVRSSIGLDFKITPCRLDVTLSYCDRRSNGIIRVQCGDPAVPDNRFSRLVLDVVFDSDTRVLEGKSKANNLLL